MNTYSLELARVKTDNEPIIDCSDKVLILGTCFASAFINSFTEAGIEAEKIPGANQIYSPEAVSIFFDFCAHEDLDLEDYIIEDRQLGGLRFLPFGISTGVFDDREHLRQALDAEMTQYRQDVRQADAIIIFLGTSRVIRTINGGKLVNKVDGLAQENWNSEHMTSEGIRDALENIIARIRQLNPRAHIIFGIDPQRYLFAFVDDCYYDNYLSKALLLQGLYETLKRRDDVHYFKVLEIVQEELRHCEYINARDMVHVNSLTVSHVFHRFAENYFNARTLAALTGMDGLLNRVTQLRPFENAGHIAEVQKNILRKHLDALCGDDISLLVAPDNFFTTIRKVAEKCSHTAVQEKLRRTYCERYRFLRSGGSFFVWGTGGRIANTIAPLLEDNERCLGFIDNDAAKQGKDFCGRPVYAPEVLSRTRPDLVVIASTYYQDIKMQIGTGWPGTRVRYVGCHLPV